VTDRSRPTVRGIHHVKVPVSDLAASRRFYETALGAVRLPGADHRHADGRLYAHVLRLPGTEILLELRHNPEQAARHHGFDPLTLAVADRAELAEWDRLLTALGVPHSPVIVSIRAWVMVVEDPDGIRVRLYTAETHGPELPPDEDNPWVAG
jgi:catechol 2,3-dioxygenase-like lactoylglutathione lyase family enzyme